MNPNPGEGDRARSPVAARGCCRAEEPIQPVTLARSFRCRTAAAARRPASLRRAHGPTSATANGVRGRDGGDGGSAAATRSVRRPPVPRPAQPAEPSPNSPIPTGRSQRLRSKSSSSRPRFAPGVMVALPQLNGADQRDVPSEAVLMKPEDVRSCGSKHSQHAVIPRRRRRQRAGIHFPEAGVHGFRALGFAKPRNDDLGPGAIPGMAAFRPPANRPGTRSAYSRSACSSR